MTIRTCPDSWFSVGQTVRLPDVPTVPGRIVRLDRTCQRGERLTLATIAFQGRGALRTVPTTTLVRA